MGGERRACICSQQYDHFLLDEMGWFGQNSWQTMCSRRDSGGTTFEIGLSDGADTNDNKMFYYYDGVSIHQPWRTRPPKDSWVHVLQSNYQ